MSPGDAAKVLGVSEEKAKELLAKARRPAASVSKTTPTSRRGPKAGRQSRSTEPKPVTFYGPLG